MLLLQLKSAPAICLTFTLSIREPCWKHICFFVHPMWECDLYNNCACQQPVNLFQPLELHSGVCTDIVWAVLALWITMWEIPFSGALVSVPFLTAVRGNALIYFIYTMWCIAFLHETARGDLQLRQVVQNKMSAIGNLKPQIRGVECNLQITCVCFDIIVNVGD